MKNYKTKYHNIKKTNQAYKVTMAVLFVLALSVVGTATTIINSESISTDFMGAFSLLGDIDSDGYNVWNGIHNYADYDYLIVQNATHVFAINGTTGSIDFSNTTDAGYLINDCIDNLESGGYIFIKEGIYNVDTDISIDGKQIHISGAVVGHPVASNGGTILKAGSGIDIFSINSVGDTYTPSTHIENMLLTNQSGVNGGSGIYSKGQYGIFENLIVERFENGIVFEMADLTGGISSGDNVLSNIISRHNSFDQFHIASGDNQGNNLWGHANYEAATRGMTITNSSGYQLSGSFAGTNVHLWGNSNGLFMESGQNIHFTNLYTEDNSNAGIVVANNLDEVRNVTIVNWNSCGNTWDDLNINSVSADYKINNWTIIGGMVNSRITLGANTADITIIDVATRLPSITITDSGTNNAIINFKGGSYGGFEWGKKSTPPTAYGLGDTYDNSTSNCKCFYTGSSWVRMDNHSIAC